MNDARFDVVVAGGGPVGWACALAAQVALGKRSRVAVIERDPLPVIAADDPIAARVYTVASGNLAWLAEHGVAVDRARSTTVTDIQVFGRDGGLSLGVSANDSGLDELACVIEHEALAVAIAARALQAGVTLIAGECIALHDQSGGDRESEGKGTGYSDDARTVELADRRLLQSRLVLAADGAHSRLRESVGMVASRHSYPQQGVVANLRCGRAHENTARQWFLADGSILAFLPLPALPPLPTLPPQSANASSVSMVWSVSAERAQFLCELSATALLAEINAASADTLDVNAVINGTQRFPLSLLRLPDPVAARFVAVGDAAHTFHPLAGQGVNVGLADARCLFDLWQRVAEVHADPGHSLLLSRYRRQRYGPTLAMQLATDGLFRLYNQFEHPFLMAAGDAGMRLLGRLPAFRRTLSTNALQ